MDVKHLCGERTKYVFLTANLANNALSEIFYLLAERYDNKKVEYILGSMTFRFFRASLYYMFNAEYCKLFEREDGKRGNNVSSLIKLNNYHQRLIGKKFNDLHYKNEELLNQILESDFNKIQRSLRDTKFSHSDICQLNDFSISPPSEDEFNAGFQHMKWALEVINNCHTMFETEYFFSIPENTTTQTFISQQTEYQSFYFDKVFGGNNLDD